MPWPRVALLSLALCAAGCSAAVEPTDAATRRPPDRAPIDPGPPDAALVPFDVYAPEPDAGFVPPDAPPAVDVPARRGPPYPIVLHHGFAGFREIGPVNYFFNVARDLRAHGEAQVFEAEVSPFNSPAVRARELARYVDMVLATTGSARVVIIGHSQGGLDARYLVSSLGYGDRVALVATVATPHRGSRVADVILGLVPGITDDLINATASLIGAAYNDVRTRADLRETLVGLSESAAAEFNRANPDDPRVQYWSWTGRTNLRTGAVQCAGSRVPNEPLRLDATDPLLLASTTVLERLDPIAHVNDGMVEVQSARWGVFMGCVPADHFDEVGQIAQVGPVLGSGFDHLAFYRDIVRRARDAGF